MFTICYSNKVDDLEDLRKIRLHEIVVLLQKNWKAWTLRRRFISLRKSQKIIAQNYRIWKVCLSIYTGLSLSLPYLDNE